MVNEGVAIGIGCYNFYTPGLSKEASGAAWSGAVTETLEAVPSVQRVHILPPTDFDNWSVGNRAIGSHENLDAFLQLPSDGRVSFQVSIPQRIQESLGVFNWADQHVEQFDITILYGYDAPVALVTGIGASVHADASSAVIIVREFLKREISRLAKPAAEFLCMGPSPFHIDMSLRPASAAEEASANHSRDAVDGFTYRYFPRAGYNQVEVYYDNSRYTETKLAVDAFTRLTIRQLGAFYNLVHSRNENLHTVWAIRGDAQQLIDLHMRPGLATTLRRVFRSGKLARELSIAAINLEFMLAQDARQQRELVEYISDLSPLPVFMRYLEKELDNDFSESLRNCRELANHLEPRRLREVNAIWVVLIAIISAVLGAVIQHVLAG